MSPSQGSGNSQVSEMIDQVQPGSRKHFHMTVATSPSGAPIYVPLIIVRGASEGPTLGVFSGVHGDEGPSSLAVTRFCRAVDPGSLSGMILALPIANTPAFENMTRTNNWDKGDLVRLWPGKEDGSITEQTGHVIFREVVSRLDYLVDLHCGTPILNEFWALYANPRSPVSTISDELAEKSRGMAVAFGVDQILRRHPWYTTVAAAGAAGVPTIVAEIGGGPDFYQRADYYYELMENGLSNVAKSLDMLPGDIEHRFDEVVEYDIAEDILTAVDTGHWRRTAGPGDQVQPGDVLGHFVDPYTGEIITEVAATKAGTVLNPHVSWSQVTRGQWLLAIGELVERHKVT
jgi:uncharacterized protein